MAHKRKKKRVLVTGAGGFIGSALVYALNQRGMENILVTDVLGRDEKWKNLSPLKFDDYLQADELLAALEFDTLGPIDTIFHLGACSATTETDGAYLVENNYRYTQTLAEWALKNGTRFVYASSAATYGDGERGMDDRDKDLAKLRPLNLYGYSKHLFDLHAQRRGYLGDIVGIKYFNVYGPNEYHKGHMASVLAKVFDGAKAGQPVRLFKSHREGIADGEQRRDFIYVEDAVAVLHWLLERGSVNGIFNVGTGKAESFRDMITAMFSALGRTPNIEYIDMPEAIRGQYQYFTQASTENLRRAGYDGQFTPLNNAVERYVTGYLNSADRFR